MKLAGNFPGQGSQVVGMGAEFLQNSELAKEIFAEADSVLGFELSKLCLEGPLESLTLTENAQPAILTVSYICHSHSDIELSAVAGHSLGEYTALIAAGVISFSDAVQLVNKRGRYMQEAVAPGVGAMAAVLGPTEEEIAAVIATVDAGIVEIANLNCPGQTVVAGDNKGVAAFSEKMAAAGGKIMPLNVSAPFHCSLMAPAADKLAADLDAIAFSEPTIPVYANVTANKIANAAEAKELLKQQVCSSVRWTESMNNMIANEQIDGIVEFGAGGVLSRLMKRINKGVARLEVASPESLEKAIASLEA